MRKGIILLFSILFIITVSCKEQKQHSRPQRKATAAVETGKKTKIVTLEWSDSLVKALKDTAYKAAVITQRVLGKKLHALVKTKGPEYAVEFCSDEAMRLTDSVSRALGLNIKRLAKKYRNPDNQTLGRDSLIFKRYILDWLGHRPLTEKIIPDREGHPVYYNPIKVSHFCLTCHGEPGVTMDNKLAEKIKEHYPGDRATGFKEGQLRGMWVITFPQYTIKRR